MSIKIYNSSDVLIFDGTMEQYDILRSNNLINDSDRIVIA